MAAGVVQSHAFGSVYGEERLGPRRNISYSDISGIFFSSSSIFHVPAQNEQVLCTADMPSAGYEAAGWDSMWAAENVFRSQMEKTAWLTWAGYT